jgi:hypothetical protein
MNTDIAKKVSDKEKKEEAYNRAYKKASALRLEEYKLFKANIDSKLKSLNITREDIEISSGTNYNTPYVLRERSRGARDCNMLTHDELLAKYGDNV